MVPSTLRTTSLPPPTIAVICPYAIQPMKLMATTQKTGLVISRITRIISGKTPTRACERGLSLKTTTRKLKRVSTIPIDSAPEQTLSLSNSPKHLGVAYTSEIEKLEKRWAENPKGRNFAPLADAYRKAGELDRAIELCKSGLERHPDYVSAHIVYGRCFLDLKNDTAASQVFRKVLELDPENVLGLRLLAEIAERGGRYDEATEWLSRLLAVDPMNGDAAEALARAKGKAAQTAPKSAAPAPGAPPMPVPPPAVLVPERSRASATSTAPMPKPEFVVEPEQPAAPQLEARAPAGDIETFDGTLDFNAVAHDAAKAEGLEVQEEVALKPQDLTVEGLAATQYESGTFAAPDLPPEPQPESEPVVDLPLIMPEDVTPSRSPQPAWPAPLAPPPAPPAPAAQPPRFPPPAGSETPAAVVLSDDDGAADTAALSRAEPVLTETMADLYLKQGHPEDALRVYQALLAQRPGDARLHARVDALSPGGKRRRGRQGEMGESVPTFLKRILAGRPPVTAGAEPARAGRGGGAGGGAAARARGGHGPAG